jgi:hypothetical protein
MKGQLFTADVLASLLIVTVIVTYTAWELEQVYNRASDTEYEKLNALANDIAQMAVKNILANRSDGVIRANWIEPGRWSLLGGNMSEMILPPYGYEASITVLPASLAPQKISSSTGCDATKTNIAVVRRIIYMRGITGNSFPTLTIKVCV